MEKVAEIAQHMARSIFLIKDAVHRSLNYIR